MKTIDVSIFGLIFAGIVGAVISSVAKSIVLGSVAKAQIKAGESVDFRL